MDTVESAVQAIAAGRPVVVVDDEHRENEGDLIFAAQHATPELVNFMVRYTSGYICAPILPDACARLNLAPMYHESQDPRGTPYRVTCDVAFGITTGISAADRALTIKWLSDPRAVASDFTRPGHVVPLEANPGGVLIRQGHTEATMDLVRLAGCRPAGVLCELVNDDGTMKKMDDLRKFAVEHDLRLLSIEDLVAYRLEGRAGSELLNSPS